MDINTLNFDRSISSDGDNTNISNQNDDWGNIVDCNTHVMHYSHVPFLAISGDKKEEIRKIIDHIDIDNIKMSEMTSISNLALLEKASLVAKNLKYQFTKRYKDDIVSFVRWLVISLDILTCVMCLMAQRSNWQLNEVPQKSLNKNKLKKYSHISRNAYCLQGHVLF